MDFVNVITVGINHSPTNAVTTTENKVAIYYAETGGGNSLKFALKLSNFIIERITSDFSTKYEKCLKGI